MRPEIGRFSHRPGACAQRTPVHVTERPRPSRTGGARSGGPRVEESPITALLSLATGDDDAWEVYAQAARPPRDDRPWVLANFVAGLDGAVTIDGRVGALTSPTDQEVFRLLRALGDVVLVGAGTARNEDYGPVRLDERGRRLRGDVPPPPVAVVTSSLDLDPAARLFTGDVRPLVVTREDAPLTRREGLSGVADVIAVGVGEVDLPGALQVLRDRGVRVVTCEGGPRLLRDLLAADLLDELCLTIAPVIGGDPVRLIADDRDPPLRRFELASVARAGDELLLRYLNLDSETPP